MPLLYLNTTAAASFGDLVDLFPDDAFASPTRSTIPLLEIWRDSAERLEELGDVLGIPMLEPVHLRFEYSVAPTGGRGKASYTDLLIQTDGAACAVEAKFTEPRYPTVREWLGDDPSSNKLGVLGGWLEMIRGKTGVRCNPVEVAQLPYQLIHRAASACSVQARITAIGYLLFGEAPSHYNRDLEDFRHVLDPRASLKVFVLECSVAEAPTVQELRALARVKDTAVPDRVRQLVKEGALFSCGPLRQAKSREAAR